VKSRFTHEGQKRPRVLREEIEMTLCFPSLPRAARRSSRHSQNTRCRTPSCVFAEIWPPHPHCHRPGRGGRVRQAPAHQDLRANLPQIPAGMRGAARASGRTGTRSGRVDESASPNVKTTLLKKSHFEPRRQVGFTIACCLDPGRRGYSALSSLILQLLLKWRSCEISK